MSDVIVQVIRHGETEVENASKLVWWLASLGLRAGFHSGMEPQVGDVVVEVTHRLGMARHGVGLLSAVGELIKIEADPNDGVVYTLKTIEGKEQRWSNARLAIIERPGVIL